MMQLTAFNLTTRDVNTSTNPPAVEDYMTAPPTVTESMANQLPFESAQFDALNMHVSKLCATIRPIKKKRSRKAHSAGSS